MSFHTFARSLFLLLALNFAGLSAVHAGVVSGFAGGSTLLQNNGDSVLLGGAFLDNPGFSPTANPAYAGTIGVAAAYSELVANAASVTVSAEPLSLKFASGAGTSFTGPGDFLVTVNLNFTTIGAGYLPASTWFNVLDLDGNDLNGPVGSMISNLVAYDALGAIITTPWLDTFTQFDFGADPTSPGQPTPLPSDYATVTGSAGAGYQYLYQGTAAATATPVISARLTQNVSALSFRYFGSTQDNTQINFTDVSPVPEPGVSLLTGLALLTGLTRRNRRNA